MHDIDKSFRSVSLLCRTGFAVRRAKVEGRWNGRAVSSSRAREVHREGCSSEHPEERILIPKVFDQIVDYGVRLGGINESRGELLPARSRG
jgi:hypothetical protein